MPIYSYTDAKNSLNARLGHRTDLTDTRLGQWIDQAQYVIATNVRDLPQLDFVSPPMDLVIGVPSYDFSFFTSATTPLDHFWALNWVRNYTDKFMMQRGEFEQWFAMNTIPSGKPSMWCRSGTILYLFQSPAVATQLRFYYRKYPTVGTLMIGDEWFDHLVQLAQYYALTEIGKSQVKQSVVQMLPQQIQLALTHPLTPSEWEATHDSYMGVSPLR